MLSSWPRDGRLSRDNVRILVPCRKSPWSGPGLKAKRQSGLGQKSAGQSWYWNSAGQQIPVFRDKNPAQSGDGPAIPGFYGTQIPFPTLFVTRMTGTGTNLRETVPQGYPAGQAGPEQKITGLSRSVPCPFLSWPIETMGATKKIRRFKMTVEHFSKSCFRKGQYYS